MDVFERFNTKFGRWYEGLFGGENAELRPKDVLRKITAAMEDNRKEGFDNKVYVPNKYVPELAVGDPEERDYLLSFLDEEELVSVLQRFMAQNHYHVRGPLDFTIAEVPESERDTRHEKLRVQVRFEKGEVAPLHALEAPPALLPATEALRLGASSGGARVPLPPPTPGAEDTDLPAPPELAPSRRASVAGSRAGGADDPPTVAGFDPDDEPGTVPAVAWASLAVTGADGRKSNWSLTKPMVTVGRSRNAGNDLVLDGDGMVSKVHARLERERDGRWTVYDVGSTNGVKVNGQRIDGNRVLRGDDQLTVGATTLVFREGGWEDSAPAAEGPVMRRARLVADDGEEHVLASETLIGRAVTSDVVLEDPRVATRHARVVAPDAGTYYLEDLDSADGTWLNGRRLAGRQRTLLADGDRVRVGGRELRFQAGTRL